MSDDAPDGIQIGELSRLTGVGQHTLRVWERRYGVPSPRRTSGRFRVYSRDDVEIVREIQRLIAAGYSTGAAAGRVREREPRATAEVTGTRPFADEIRDLRDALATLDEATGNTALDRLFGRYSPDTAIDEVVLPYLHDLGERWSRGESSVSEEHFASFVIRGRIMSLAAGWGSGAGPDAVLACLPGERHDIGLLCLGVGFRRHGWRVVMLGADTPMDTLQQVVSDRDPDLVVVSSVDPGRFATHGGELAEIASATRLALAGAGARADLARELGADHVDEPPMAAARTLVRAARPG